MKFLKFILVLFISVSITSCGDESSDLPFVLSTSNLIGSYNVNSFNTEEIESATSSAGVTLVISKNTKIGDTFQIAFEIKSNGTYTAIGEYRSISNVTPTPSAGQANPVIIGFNISGSYELNTTDNTIILSSQSDEFIVGTFIINVFNDTTLAMSQEVEETDGGISSNIISNISFTKQ
tara:strand:+ start:3886 stop:4419 length:534 start_codon:yes stop_codon:yes gene_type:complete